jgi:hypothetical protein
MYRWVCFAPVKADTVEFHCVASADADADGSRCDRSSFAEVADARQDFLAEQLDTTFISASMPAPARFAIEESWRGRQAGVLVGVDPLVMDAAQE